MKEEIIKKMERAFEIISFEAGDVLPDHLAKDFGGKNRFKSKFKAAIEKESGIGFKEGLTLLLTTNQPLLMSFCDAALKEVLEELDPVAEKFLTSIGCYDAVHILGRW